MVIYNTTFVIDPASSEEFINWIKGCVANGLCPEESGVVAARLTTVIDVVGVSDIREQALSIALQTEFREEVEARVWAMQYLETALQQFYNIFGPEVAAFSTILAEMSLI